MTAIWVPVTNITILGYASDWCAPPKILGLRFCCYCWHKHDLKEKNKIKMADVLVLPLSFTQFLSEIIHYEFILGDFIVSHNLIK